MPVPISMSTSTTASLRMCGSLKKPDMIEDHTNYDKYDNDDNDYDDCIDLGQYDGQEHFDNNNDDNDFHDYKLLAISSKCMISMAIDNNKYKKECGRDVTQRGMGHKIK